MEQIKLKDLLEPRFYKYISYFQEKKGLTSFFTYIYKHYENVEIDITSMTEVELEVALMCILHFNSPDSLERVIHFVNAILSCENSEV